MVNKIYIFIYVYHATLFGENDVYIYIYIYIYIQISIYSYHIKRNVKIIYFKKKNVYLKI